MRILLFYFFYRVYLCYIIEYVNIFYILEFKNIILNKYFLKVNLLTENKFSEQNLQHLNLDDIYSKEYNKKEKILLVVGWIVVITCICIFFNNNVILPEVEIPIGINNNLTSINSDSFQSLLENSWNSQKFDNFTDYQVNVNTFRFVLRLNIAEYLVRYSDISFIDSEHKAMEIYNKYKDEINNFIISKQK